ncbi:MAG: hypothetical protein U1E76_11685 [Planctomycetota bacterium]
MLRSSLALAALAMLAARVLANDTVDSAIYSTTTQRRPNTGWVVQFPTGTQDYFNAVFDVVAGSGNLQGQNSVADGLPITSIALSVADFGSGRTYATVGVYKSNLAVDSTGATPDLASPVSQSFSPALSPPNLFDYVVFNLSEGAIPGGQTKLHAVEQFPPGDPGLLGLGADTLGTAPRAAFTSDGYATPALLISFLEYGLNPGQDNTATTSCSSAARLPHGRLRTTNRTQVGSGDYLSTAVRGGDTLQLAFYGSKSGDKLRLYFNVAPCTPAVAIGPVLPTIPDPDGDGTFIRLNATWPSGFGGQTFRFSAVWGNPACSAPGVGFTNCVTVVTLADLPFGNCDDGTIESGWVVQIPSGPSDYFNNHFGDGSSQNGIVGITIAVLDFVTSTPAYPTSGVSNANFGVDPTGHTPDIGNPLATVSPFTFTSGTFATTSGQYVSHSVSVAGGLLGTNVHAWVQFPPGDSGFLGVGADTSSPANGCSFFTSNGYATPAVTFLVGTGNWGMRVAVN